MRDKQEFYRLLTEADGKDFNEYGRLVGNFDFSRYVVKINRIQEPSSSRPTLVVVTVPQILADFPSRFLKTPVRRTALEDYLTRQMAARLEAMVRYDESGVSRRRLFIACPGQKILPRSSMVVTEEYVEARLYVDLPMRNGLVSGSDARDLFFDDLAQAVNACLLYCNCNQKQVDTFVNLMEDADRIRQLLPTRGWVGFVAEGARVAREGASDLPATEAPALVVDPSSLTEIETQNARRVRGCGVPSGVTVILGDAYSGRIELMHALAAGVYNHVPGDGREKVVAPPDAVYITAEPGRSIQRVNLSAFLQDESDRFHDFTTEHADAVASQAAAVVEALEAGARALFFDESDSAPEFLSGDTRLESIAGEGPRTIVPLAARARQLADDLGVSVVVAGASCVADFLPIADTVLRIEKGVLTQVTAEAKQVAVTSTSETRDATGVSSLAAEVRRVVPSSLDPSWGRLDDYIEARTLADLQFGRTCIDLSRVAQLADVYQTQTIGRILYCAKLRYLDEPHSVREILDQLDRDIGSEGLESLTRELQGDLARPRRYEVAAALNRLSTLRILRSEQ